MRTKVNKNSSFIKAITVTLVILMLLLSIVVSYKAMISTQDIRLDAAYAPPQPTPPVPGLLRLERGVRMQIIKPKPKRTY